ncbi:MAG: hypothetical protein LBU18_01580 [Treponema sp.]|jgi:hypothetical protein|nr:hypothetical protein [Treponema sp.]
MKRLYAAASVMLVYTASLWAAPPAPRTFELGFNLEAGFANNYMRAADIFKKTIEFDFTQKPKPISFDAGADFDFFLNVNVKDAMGVGMFIGTDAAGQFSISKDIQELLQGNEFNKTYEGDIGTGGQVFLETGALGYFDVKDFRIVLRPAYYFPFLYLTPNTHYKFYTGNSGDINAFFEYDLAVYTPFSGTNGLFNGTLTGRGGVDFTASVDYPLSIDHPYFTDLSVGASISHIPVFPAQLVNRTVISGGKSLDSDDMLQELIDNGDLSGIITDRTIESSHNAIMIFRPFRLEINADYKPPIDVSFLSLSVLPQIGYAYNKIFVKPHSLEGSLKLRLDFLTSLWPAPLFSFTLGSGYEDKIWKQGIDLTLNLRAFQFNIGAAMQSENFINSFKAGGIAVNTGMRFGW